MNDNASGKRKRYPSGKYKPNDRPVLHGAAKCKKKGHRPAGKLGFCSRCHYSYAFEGMTLDQILGGAA